MIGEWRVPRPGMLSVRPCCPEPSLQRAGPLGPRVPTLWTFGDSVLDCAHYNRHRVHPAGLMLRNDDLLFPAFRGRDLQHQDPSWRLEHRAVDGARVDGLARQARGTGTRQEDVALVSIGGNDLLGGLLEDEGPGFARFQETLEEALRSLRPARLLIANVYDPTFGDDRGDFTGADLRLARANLRRMNDLLAGVARRHGEPVDLHGHFLTGSPAWFTATIEPSLEGASEVRRVFLDHVQAAPRPREVGT